MVGFPFTDGDVLTGSDLNNGLSANTPKLYYDATYIPIQTLKSSDGQSAKYNDAGNWQIVKTLLTNDIVASMSWAVGISSQISHQPHSAEGSSVFRLTVNGSAAYSGSLWSSTSSGWTGGPSYPLVGYVGPASIAIEVNNEQATGSGLVQLFKLQGGNILPTPVW